MPKYKEDIRQDWEGATGKEVKAAATPGYPGDSLVKNEGDPVEKDTFRKILGKVMWYARKITPESSNAIRELAMFMDNPGEEHWKALGRLVGYLVTSPGYLLLRRPRDLRVFGLVDSNFATNKETRKSITGYLVTLGGCLVSCMSKTQPALTLSSTEAEYYAASMCATEIKFLQMLMEELFPEKNLRPATLLEDNTGAIYLIENQAVGNRTKHIDIRMHHIREMTSSMEGELPRMTVTFVRSEENAADVLTKNVTEKIHDKLVPLIREGRLLEVYDSAHREDVKK